MPGGSSLIAATSIHLMRASLANGHAQQWRERKPATSRIQLTSCVRDSPSFVSHRFSGSVVWAVEAEDAFLDLERRLDPDSDYDILVSVAEYMIEWANVGPPNDDPYDDTLLVWVGDVPGTPLVVEYVKGVLTDPPNVIVRRFRSHR